MGKVMTETSDFEPSRLFRSPHIQTLIGSRGRGHWVRLRAAELLRESRQLILTVNDGIKLEAWLSLQPRPAATVILIHGWLGHADSSYVLSAAAELWHAGFSVIRLNLRDHGDTAHLNPELFHSARTEEVVNAIIELQANHATGPTGLTGFSLGGNFALRVARAIDIETIAICPVVDPRASMISIDGGFMAYRLFFIRKWHRALTAKERAHPERYRFDQARKLSTVSALTEMFVREHTDFSSTDDYLSAYSLMGDALNGTSATIVYAEDDPVIPAAGFDALPDSITLRPTRYGGHCAFVSHPARPTWSDRYLTRGFQDRLT
jgi:predicted alpha/beta-fold hydrolase